MLWLHLVALLMLPSTGGARWKIQLFIPVQMVVQDLRKTKILGPAGVPQIDVETEPLDLVYNTTIVTNLSAPTDPPFYMDMRQSTNDQWDFLKFVVYLLDAGKLKVGDIFVMDNAKVHGGLATIAILTDLLTAAGVILRFMPNFSPELNPAEQVHNSSKRAIRSGRTERNRKTLLCPLLTSWKKTSKLLRLSLICQKRLSRQCPCKTSGRFSFRMAKLLPPQRA